MRSREETEQSGQPGISPTTIAKIVGTDIFHAAALLWVAGFGHLVQGNVDLHAMAWLLLGSIPGIWISSRYTLHLPQDALRLGLAGVSGSVSPRSPFGCSYNRETVKRNAPTILVLLLLTATATAFVVTQHLKLEPSPISQTHVDKVFSPVCECETSAAHIDFSIRRADHLRIWVRTPAGPVTIADREYPKGSVHVRWNGRNPEGAVVPDGIYYAAVHMRRAQRTIDLPNPIQVDTQRPTIRLTGVQHTSRAWTFRYVASEPAHAILFVNGTRAVFTNLKRRRGHFKWHGYLGNKLVLTPRRLVLEAEDVAGNRSLPSRIETA